VAELLLAIFSWVAKEERRKISERTKAGLLKKKLEGKVLGRPTGWRKSKIDGVDNPKYKKLLKRSKI
jgi:DNA invertase Pin-like site-specific DNA recombinase